jgi:hypothetical protein
MPSSSKFEDWLKARGVPSESVATLSELAGTKNLFETPARIMEPDSWFYFPGNTRFVLIGSSPNGDAIALDTKEQPGAVVFIDHDRVHDAVPDQERIIKVADSLPDYLQSCIDDPDFPSDYDEAKSRG